MITDNHLIFYRYTCQKSLDDHTLYVHNNEEKGKEVCEFCGRRFVSRSSVANHVQTVHWAEAGLEDKNVSCLYKERCSFIAVYLQTIFELFTFNILVEAKYCLSLFIQNE